MRIRLAPLPELRLLGWGLLLNGLWEALQSPLYADAGKGAAYLLWTRAHCTLGDVLILLVVYLLTALAFRTRFWFALPARLPTLVFVGLGLSYTAASEWLNTRLVLSWEYAPAMPRLVGIGLAPLAQWLVVPLAVLALVRRTQPPPPHT